MHVLAIWIGGLVAFFFLLGAYAPFEMYWGTFYLFLLGMPLLGFFAWTADGSQLTFGNYLLLIAVCFVAAAIMYGGHFFATRETALPTLPFLGP